VHYLAYIFILKPFAWCHWWVPKAHEPWCTVPLASAVWLPLLPRQSYEQSGKIGNIVCRFGKMGVAQVTRLSVLIW